MRRGEILAAFVALAIAVPLVYALGLAVADGQARAREVPIRALIGDDAFEALTAGHGTPTQYVGRDRSAPDFTLQDQRGRDWRLSDHRGKVVIMNFWTESCQPCVEEMPSLEQLAGVLADRDDVELVTVSTDAGWGEVESHFAPDSKLTVLFDPESEVVEGKFGTRLFPETWFVDRDGIIRLRVDGARDWSHAIVLDVIAGL
jgi:peroxiredoxin